MKKMNDSELVALLARGDEGAFSKLMREHGPAVYRYAWALADSPNHVDDLLQDTFLVMWKSRRKITLVGDSMLPWLLTTCRYTAYNSNRRERARRTLPLDAAAVVAAPTDQLGWLRDEIDALGDVDRRLVQLCLVEGRSYSEAAEHLGLSVTAARKRIQRTRSRLAAVRAAGD